ncbi:13418_t:CDS:2, partial [Racocetra persica]
FHKYTSQWAKRGSGRGSRVNKVEDIVCFLYESRGYFANKCLSNGKRILGEDNKTSICYSQMIKKGSSIISKKYDKIDKPTGPKTIYFFKEEANIVRAKASQITEVKSNKFSRYRENSTKISLRGESGILSSIADKSKF